MRWRRYRRGGARAAAFREHVFCPSNPQRTGTGVQEYRGPRVMVFAFVAEASYAAGPTCVIGGLGLAAPHVSRRGPRGAMRWRCYRRRGAWVGCSACVAVAFYAALGAARFKRRHEMALLQKRGSQGWPLHKRGGASPAIMRPVPGRRGRCPCRGVSNFLETILES